MQFSRLQLSFLLLFFISLISYASYSNATITKTATAGLFVTTSSLFPPVHNGSVVVSNFSFISSNQNSSYCTNQTAVFANKTMLSFPFDYATYNWNRNTYDSGFLKYQCINGNWYVLDPAAAANMNLYDSVSGIKINGICKLQNKCTNENGTCAVINSTRVFDNSMYQCANINGVANWRLGVLTQSYVPDENRTNPPVRSGLCPDINMCKAFNGNCYEIGANRSNLFCNSDGNWWVLTQSYVPGEPRVNPPAKQGTCPKYNQCIYGGVCFDFQASNLNMLCNSDGNWGVLTRSYVPDENRSNPPVRSGICPNLNMCIANNGECFNPLEERSGLSCWIDSNWYYRIFSYEVGTNRSVGVNLCPKDNMCVSSQGGCYEIGALVNGMVCSRNNNWTSCLNISRNDWRVVNETNAVERDVSDNATYICRNGAWTPLSCTPDRNVSVDVILDTFYDRNSRVTDDMIRAIMNKMSVHLCSQMDRYKVGFTLRNVIRGNYSGVSGPRTGAFLNVLSEIYQNENYPQYVIFSGNITNRSVGGIYTIINTGVNYCNAIYPIRIANYMDDNEENTLCAGNCSNPRLTMNFSGGVNSFVATVTNVWNGNTFSDLTYGPHLLIHEFLHAYTYSSHYSSDACQSYLRQYQPYGYELRSIVGICPNSIWMLEMARHVCR